MPASLSRVSTPCSMRPLGRPRRRGVEEPDCRDIVVAPNRWPNRGPGATASPKSATPAPGGRRRRWTQGAAILLVTLAYASGSPHATGGDGGAGDANGYAA